MSPLDTFRFSLRALGDNKMRASLTMLGIIIGVAAVVIAVSVGQGASANISNSIGQLGSNLVTILPGNSRVGPGQAGTGGIPQTMTPADADAILVRCAATVAAVCPQVRSSIVAKAGSKTWRTSLTGASPSFASVNNYTLGRGRLLKEGDENSRARVVCIGITVAKNLFGGADAHCIGREIAINRVRFQVVGLLGSKGASAFGQDQDDIVWMPLATAMNRVLNQRNVSFISVQCRSESKIALAQEQMISLLRRRHHLLPPFPLDDDFTIISQTQILGVIQTIGAVVTLLLAGVAAISLTVGGVGIMNIMLVSVTERTREIGIRKALGATESNIRWQFLIESVLLSLFGGLGGILIGFSLSILAGKLSGWPIAPSLISAVLAVGVSASIGIFFGLWPAGKAARLHPIEALRRE